MRARHDGDAIAVADDDVARHDDRAAAADRHVDLAGTVLVAATGANGPAKGGKAERREPVDVANGAVDDDSAEASGDGGVAHQLTEDGARRVAARVDDDDVARRRDL